MVIFAQKTSSSNYYVERHEEECFYAFCTRTAALAAVPKSALVGETVLCNNFFSRGGMDLTTTLGNRTSLATSTMECELHA